jgi:BirA family transcriptional regulator, biotin operon repressor / biotin---[acetyl-CoA-carboxylase] ligase
MATPYIQVRIATAPSTQEVARSLLGPLPSLVIASGQSEGRGRTGSTWVTAPRALAVSLAFQAASDLRPFSLIAGVAAVRALGQVRLKWPNDVLVGDSKAGGILVERSGDVVVAGLGANLWWPEPPEGYGFLFADDPGPDLHVELGALWGAEMVRLVGESGWSRDEYMAACATLGREISWDPDGMGRAVDVDADGGLVVETSEGRKILHSGAVRYIR